MRTIAQVSPRSYGFLVFYATCSTALLGLSTSLTSFLHQDAWIIPVVASLLGAGVVFLYTVLARWYPISTIYEMNDQIFGKPIGTVFSLLFLSLPVFHFPAITSYSVTFIQNYTLPSTPFIVIAAIGIGIIAFGIFSGIEPIARTAELCFVFFIVPLLFLIFTTSPLIDIGFLQPYFTSSMFDMTEAFSIFLGNVISNVVIQLTVFPKYLAKKKAGERALWTGYALGCLTLTIITFLCIAVLSPELVAVDHYPAFTLAQEINAAGFLQRVEATITVVWFICIYFNLVLYFHCIIIALKHFLKLTSVRTLIPAIALLLVYLADYYFNNIAEERSFYQYVSVPHSITVGTLLPILMVTVGIIKRKKHQAPLYPAYPDEATVYKLHHSKETKSSKQI
ncbi:GerAB/ArcD/ProY family transporter [Geomicrobium sediminis]|uniref:Spore germination protein KB n=1 Tax=Geomicrobium sediminis TaxID=1347788 RepID=A0ABS2PBN7_9BACL|nr:endospore germination permease [Geomicrobium sediminis]MBM7632717.1 spore germination protein KB [Geomicrobium sediminis]